MKRILWVLPKNIFPVNDGAKKANYSLLSSICKKDIEVDLLVFTDSFYDEDEYCRHFKIKNIFFVERKSHTSRLIKIFTLGIQFIKHPTLPMTASFFAGKDVKKKINIVLKNKYDFIVFDGLHPYLGFKSFELPQVIYRAHNVECDLWYTKALKTKNLFYNLILKWQGKKIERLENELLRKSKVVWTIAEEDLLRFKSEVPRTQYENIHVGLKFENKYQGSNDKIRRFVFLGKLDWEPNKDGLIWFLKEIWPLVDKKNNRLLIAGSGSVSSIEPYLDQSGIKFLGFIEDVDELYSIADASIIPIRYGSGTRIKVIEAVSKKIPLISGEMGVQGAGIKIDDFFLVRSKEEWINIINNFDSNLALEKASRAFSSLEQIYNADEIANRALDSIK